MYFKNDIGFIIIIILLFVLSILPHFSILKSMEVSWSCYRICPIARGYCEISTVSCALHTHTHTQTVHTLRYLTYSAPG